VTLDVVDLRAEIRDLLKLLGTAILAVLLCIIVGFLGLGLLLSHGSPPKERQVIRNFEEHRATFEQLRDMLLQDEKLLRVADWGVETSTPPMTSKPPAGGFPLDRYNQYMSLLKEVGSRGALRNNGPPADACVWIYASGFAGDTRHLDICWEEQVPVNQVASLDDFYKTPKPRKPVFRHVDSNWYLWADW
jgi:hypothetical protein